MRRSFPGSRSWRTAAAGVSLVLGLGACSTTSRQTAVRPVGEEGGFPAWADRYFWGAGGLTNIRALNSIVTNAAVTIAGAPAKRLSLHAVQLADGRYRYEMRRADGDVLVQAYDGRVGWRTSKKLGVGLVPPVDLHALMLLDNLPAQERAAEDTSRWQSLPNARRPDGGAWHVAETTDAFGVRWRWYFDPRGKALSAIARLGPGIEGGTVLAMSDFRPVQDLSFSGTGGGPLTYYLPMKLVRMHAGVRMEISKQSVTLDAPVDDKIFAPPLGVVAEARATDEILARYLQACGGAEALGRIKTRIIKEVTEVTTNGMKMTATIYQKAPDRILTVTQVPGVGREREGFDGRVGWAESEIQGVRKLQGAELAQLLLLADLRSALHMPEEYPLRRLLPDRQVGGRRVRVVRMATLNAEAGTCYFDAASGQLVRSDSSVSVGPHGRLKLLAEFSDFRTVDGVTLPFVTVMTNPAVRMVTRIQSVRDNVPIDDRLFKQPRND